MEVIFTNNLNKYDDNAELIGDVQTSYFEVEGYKIIEKW